MSKSKPAPEERLLRVYADRSELILSNGSKQTYFEGAMSEGARERYVLIANALRDGFLREQIAVCRTNPQAVTAEELTDEQRSLIERLAAAMTSEVGRALIGLTILQLCVKSIAPEQSIRLHKGGASNANFSWREGISMRTLDNKHVTPALRAEGLLRLNNDGFMMTRSLAENYPYSQFYKAAIRGARHEWLDIVEALETGAMQPLSALRFLIAQLLNQAQEFEALAKETNRLLKSALQKRKLKTRDGVASLIARHVNESDYAARLMEIAMHALMQALEEMDALVPAVLVPLSQMRSANKKHGNIGDIELQEDGRIVESWDAKFGKSYLRDELEELNDKLLGHDSVTTAGFVSSEAPDLKDVTQRANEMEQLHGVKIHVLSLQKWVAEQYQRANKGEEQQLCTRWLTAYVESLAQQRLEKAPIDEPCFSWLNSLKEILASHG